ncbi:MAG: cupin domain-containing protein [Acidimicrobiia bacterium]
METGERAPRRIRLDDLTDDTAQTTNLHRFVAIDPAHMDMSGPWKLYFGRATTPPHSSSGPHHHGDAETGGYVLSGRCRIYFGEGFKKFMDFEKGDFIYVPPHLPHIEANEGDEPFVGLLVRSPDNIVVNLDEE